MANEIGESLREHRIEINVIEKTLRDLYYNPETGYQNAEKLFKDIQKYDFGITRKGVQSWLEAQPAYTQHKQLIDAYGETSFTSGVATETFDEEGRPITPLANNSEYQRDRALRKRANIVKSAILDVTGKHWDARLDSLNTRDVLDNIEIKGDREPIWYKGKIVYKKVAGKYVMSSDKRSIEYIKEFRQQLTDINVDFAEGNSSDQQSIEQLVTINTILKNNLLDISVEIETKPTVKGIIDNALSFDPNEAESP